MTSIKDAKALTISYLTPVSFASLNGSDKEADNISSIKKITVDAEEYPYVSSQAVRRALRDQLAVLGWALSEGAVSSIKKGAATTKQMPEEYIDDDLFGYMGTESAKSTGKGKSTKRTSVVRVSPLMALTPYAGDLDFGTNYMGEKAGGDPNIFETEIHSGIYRGTILIELDRVGCGDGFKNELSSEEKAERIKALLRSLKNLWGSGRQSRFLADISPKFVAAAFTTSKNPIFLESLCVDKNGVVGSLLDEVAADYKEEVVELVYGERKGLFKTEFEKAGTIGDAFDKLNSCIDEYYQ